MIFYYFIYLFYFFLYRFLESGATPVYPEQLAAMPYVQASSGQVSG